MSTGLYPNLELIERNQTSVSVAAIAQTFLAPCDLDIIGLVFSLATTAPGTGNGVAVNISCSPTSQLPAFAPAGAANQAVVAYNLWTTANQPSILGANKLSFTPVAPAVVQNSPYALKYPFPGPSGTVGYQTAQATSQTTETPVTAPPTMYEYGIPNLVAPDNSYSDLNAQTQLASYVHAGDVLTFSVLAAGANASIGSAAGAVEIVLYANKR